MPDVAAFYKAKNAGRARAMCARTIEECFSVPMGRAFIEITVRREPGADGCSAIGLTEEGAIGTHDYSPPAEHNPGREG